MTNQDKIINSIIDGGYEFKLNQYINDGFNIFKRNVGGFVGYFIIMIAIILILSLFLYGIGGLFQPVLAAGIFFVANEIIKQRNPDFSLFFKGFDFFIQLILLSIVMNALVFVGMLLFIIPGIYLAISYQFANMFVVFLGYEFWPAMEYSRKLITKDWWNFFVFFIILFLINLAGALTIIGILFTAPATMCMIYCAFEDIVGGAIRKNKDNDLFNSNNTTYTYNI